MHASCGTADQKMSAARCQAVDALGSFPHESRSWTLGVAALKGASLDNEVHVLRERVANAHNQRK